jgi:hypothetical protein
LRFSADGNRRLALPPQRKHVLREPLLVDALQLSTTKIKAAHVTLGRNGNHNELHATRHRTQPFLQLAIVDKKAPTRTPTLNKGRKLQGKFIVIIAVFLKYFDWLAGWPQKQSGEHFTTMFHFL